jgi:site-specific DNA recombinase
MSSGVLDRSVTSCPPWSGLIAWSWYGLRIKINSPLTCGVVPTATPSSCWWLATERAAVLSLRGNIVHVGTPGKREARKSQRVVIYCRISEDRKDAEEGVTRQQEDCRELLSRYPEWELVHEPFVDNDISATKGKPRPGFEEIMRMVYAGQVDIVVCWTTSRFLRSRQDRLRVIDLFKDHGVRVIPVKGPTLDYSSASGRLMADMMGSFDVAAAEETAERVARQGRQRAEEGRPHGGPRRFGFTASGMTVIPEEKEVIKEIAQRVIDGHSLHSITLWLNERRERNEPGTAPTRAKIWRSTSVRAMLLSPALIGRRMHNHVDVGPAAHGAILDEAIFYSVQARLTTNRSFAPSSRLKYLLSGIPRCGNCGCVMFGVAGNSGGTKYLYYACPIKTHGGCAKVYRRLEPTENHVETLVKAYLRKHRARLISESPSNVDINALETGIRGLEDALVAVAVQYAGRTDDLSRRMFSAAEKSLRESLEPLVLQRDEATRASSLGDLVAVKDIDAYWGSRTLARKREIIRALADITIHPANKKKGFDPLLVDVDFTKSGGTDIDKLREDYAGHQAAIEEAEAALDDDAAAAAADEVRRTNHQIEPSGSVTDGWAAWDKAEARKEERVLLDFLIKDVPEPTDMQLNVIGAIPRVPDEV